METAADILFNLAEMFADQGRQARQEAMRKLMNCRMKQGTSVRVHMLEVIGLLNELEVMGAEIDGETQVYMAIETLSDAFDAFRLNYSMNKLNYTLTQLMKELQSTEAVMNKSKGKEKAEAHFASSSKASSSQGKGHHGRKRKKSNEPAA